MSQQPTHLGNAPSHRGSRHPEDDPEVLQQKLVERIERENRQLREYVKNLEGVVRCVARTVTPYAKPR